ncbi:hypothetical protein JMUB7524_27260 [Staphylococcus aureus]
MKAELVQSFVERRKGKATEEQAQELLNNVNYFGTMPVSYTHLRAHETCADRVCRLLLEKNLSLIHISEPTRH